MIRCNIGFIGGASGWIHRFARPWRASTHRSAVGPMAVAQPPISRGRNHGSPWRPDREAVSIQTVGVNRLIQRLVAPRQPDIPAIRLPGSFDLTPPAQVRSRPAWTTSRQAAVPLARSHVAAPHSSAIPACDASVPAGLPSRSGSTAACRTPRWSYTCLRSGR